jgi:RimJ/RimL family protein N-acetyltransferase
MLLAMEVRPARLGDAEAAALAYQQVAEEREFIGSEPPIDPAVAAEQVRDWVRSNSDQLWILENEGRLLGQLSLHRNDRPQGVASLGMLVVPGARGQGGGRMLLDAALQWARTSDVYRLELEVFVENARAIGMYAKAGFDVEGVRRERYLRQDGSRRSTLLMALFV